MTLDEAILHEEEVADDQEEHAIGLALEKECLECAAEHRQLAEWLKDYKRLLAREKEDVPIDIEQAYIRGYNNAKQEIAFSGEYERAFQRGYDKAIKEREEVDAGDCISREAVREFLLNDCYRKEFCEEHHIERAIDLHLALIKLNDLPSVSPKGMTKVIEEIKKEIGRQYHITINSNGEPAMTLGDIFRIFDKYTGVAR